LARFISARRAAQATTSAARPETSPTGFVDTGDIVERRGERYYFVGRKDGVINVGGHKVRPEEVEAVLNCHPGVRMSFVRGRKSPITGAVVVADVVASATRAADHGLERYPSEEGRLF
jgi:acyl-coenzyme A synthetase/AMP-(fatty) acid ligase